jgi:hypothetical protein
MDAKKLKKLALAIDLDTQPTKTLLKTFEELDSAVENIQSDITVIQDDAQLIVKAIGDIEQTKATKQELEFAMASVQTQKGDRGFKGEKGDSGRDGKDGKDGSNGKDGINGLNGSNGIDGKDGLNAVVDYEKVVNEVTSLVDFETDSPEEIRNKLELLSGSERLDISAIKGVKELEDKIKSGNTYIQQGGVSETQVKTIVDSFGISKTISYNVDGTVNVITTANGTKTLNYNIDGTLASITGTGIYKNKAFTYSGGVLTAITV